MGIKDPIARIVQLVGTANPGYVRDRQLLRANRLLLEEKLEHHPTDNPVFNWEDEGLTVAANFVSEHCFFLRVNWEFGMKGRIMAYIISLADEERPSFSTQMLTQGVSASVELAAGGPYILQFVKAPEMKSATASAQTTLQYA